jgi:hypothetical protein
VEEQGKGESGFIYTRDNNQRGVRGRVVPSTAGMLPSDLIPSAKHVYLRITNLVREEEA